MTREKKKNAKKRYTNGKEEKQGVAIIGTKKRSARWERKEDEKERERERRSD